MPTRTKFVFLMHPKEFKEEKAATGRLTHLCLPNSEIHMGVGFDDHELVAALIRDPRNFPVLVYPGEQARNLSNQEFTRAELGDRQLVVFLLDGTWACARKMLRLSPSLQRLPRVMFTATAPSRYVIKRQPQEGCLSTLEATHELLLALERSGLDRYEQPEQLLALFQRMQDFQVQCMRDPALRNHHRAVPSVKLPRALDALPGTAALTNRRRRYLRAPDAADPVGGENPPAATEDLSPNR